MALIELDVLGTKPIVRCSIGAECKSKFWHHKHVIIYNYIVIWLSAILLEHPLAECSPFKLLYEEERCLFWIWCCIFLLCTVIGACRIVGKTLCTQIFFKKKKKPSLPLVTISIDNLFRLRVYFVEIRLGMENSIIVFVLMFLWIYSVKDSVPCNLSNPRWALCCLYV